MKIVTVRDLSQVRGGKGWVSSIDGRNEQRTIVFSM